MSQVSSKRALLDGTRRAHFGVSKTTKENEVVPAEANLSAPEAQDIAPTIVQDKSAISPELSVEMPAAQNAETAGRAASSSLLREIKLQDKNIEKVAVNIRLDADLNSRFNAAAESTRCSKTAILSIALDNALKELGF
ncbi:hypothetical protein [Pseudochrobactrum kiredjianiae]|uniref:Ribbon-helix-helix protein, CopG family n=1 Tax=Pseudochrobactrum kiredjianiae TaxID=386305 RepID=A0ABW3UZB4_9HYPH|nr:hypothetical protein [Pseudochrobactrum kiredjianiae]MDM7852965.1 hypothetical protein [Pseudochrobactrum kiredjianiae]